MIDCSLLALDYCIAEHTPIVTTEGNLPIEDIKIGMGVLSCKNGAKVCIQKVVKSACYIGHLPTMLIRTDDGSTAVCTHDHTWMRFDGTMAKTIDLLPGDRLAHVKEGQSGRYPTWYIRSYCNYIKKHKAVSEFVHGVPPKGYHVDHINGDIEDYHATNLRLLKATENYSQGGRRYWRDVQNGDRSDNKQLEALRVGLKKRRSYVGEGNPNYGKRNGEIVSCRECGKQFYIYPSQRRRFCSQECYRRNRANNHKVVGIEELPGLRAVYQITVETTHNYVLPNGMVSGNSQIELRVAAHESQDEAMLSIYRNDGDIHMETACAMFDLLPEAVDSKRHRRPAKTTNFGILYGITARGLLTAFQHEDITTFTETDCGDFIRTVENKYSGYFDWAEETRAYARRHGQVRDMFGRIRYVPEVYSSQWWIREKGLREAVNAPITMAAQGVIKEAMLQLTPIYKSWQQHGFIVRPLLQIHDELLWEIEDGVLEAVIPELHDIMVGAVNLSVPIKVDAEVGLNWNQLTEWKGTI